jgi:hypothetical protein
VLELGVYSQHKASDTAGVLLAFGGVFARQNRVQVYFSVLRCRDLDFLWRQCDTVSDPVHDDLQDEIW